MKQYDPLNDPKHPIEMPEDALRRRWRSARFEQETIGQLDYFSPHRRELGEANQRELEAITAEAARLGVVL